MTALAPEFANTIEASNHNYNCRCASCLQWWVSVGPEDTGSGWSYGPFTEAEYVAAGGVVRPYIDYDGGDDELALEDWKLTEYEDEI